MCSFQLDENGERVPLNSTYRSYIETVVSEDFVKSNYYIIALAEKVVTESPQNIKNLLNNN